jgi:hypothetical protein
VWLELVSRVCICVVLTLEDGQVLKLLTDLLGFCSPADTGNPGDILIAVLAEHALDESDVGRSVEHKRVHWTGDFTILGLHLSLALSKRAIDPSLHVSHWGINHILGDYTQWLRKIKITASSCAISLATGLSTARLGDLGFRSWVLAATRGRP